MAFYFGHLARSHITFKDRTNWKHLYFYHASLTDLMSNYIFISINVCHTLASCAGQTVKPFPIPIFLDHCMIPRCKVLKYTLYFLHHLFSLQNTLFCPNLLFISYLKRTYKTWRRHFNDDLHIASLIYRHHLKDPKIHGHTGWKHLKSLMLHFTWKFNSL